MLDMNRLITMPRLYKDTVMVIHDTVALVISIYFSSWLTYGNYEVVFSKNIFGVLVIFVIAMSIFFSLGLYRSSVRYMGYKAMFSILQATILLSGILLCAKYLMKILGMETIFGGMELRELIVFWLFITFLLMGSRQVARWLLNSIGKTGKFSRYLIYGGGDAGRQAISAIVGSVDCMIPGERCVGY